MLTLECWLIQRPVQKTVIRDGASTNIKLLFVPSSITVEFAVSFDVINVEFCFDWLLEFGLASAKQASKKDVAAKAIWTHANPETVDAEYLLSEGYKFLISGFVFTFIV